MSLILDALNRSRDDVDPVPNLSTHHPVEPLPSGRRQYLPWVALAVAFVLIVWLFLERRTASPTSAADIGAPVAELTQNIGSAAASVTNALKTRAATQEKKTQEKVSKTPPVAKVASPAVVARAAETAHLPERKLAGKSAAVRESVTATPAPLPATDNVAVARLYQNKEVSEDPEVQSSQTQSKELSVQKRASSAVADSPGTVRDEQPIDIEEILQRAQEEGKNARLDEHPVPFLSSLSQQTKDNIPTLYYQRHDYSNDASISTVVLNGNQVKVGGSPLSGMKVDEILPYSVVLSYRGTQFRLRALNSWINL